MELEKGVGSIEFIEETTLNPNLTSGVKSLIGDFMRGFNKSF